MPRIRLAAVLLMTIAVPLALQANAQQPLLLGTSWYPEQWPEARWATDLELMQAAHIHVVRVAEFSWSTLEPSEGRYDFAWLDRAIALAAQHDIKVVLGTPTAAPPAWLTQKYPDTLRVEEDGRRAEHGNRQQFSETSPKYRQFAAGIAHQMAVHYGHNPNILGWQIDNEIGAPTFDPSAVSQWHQWLAAHYKNIADLNQRWSTAYWSQTYATFDEIPFRSKGENPALLLDYKHFVTDTWTSYIQNQVDAIRPLALPSQFITTNTMHWYPVYDHYVLHKNLDLAAWDDYVPDGHLDPFLNAAQHDLVRGYKQRNFWLMETQPAFVNWGPINSPLPPGVTREMAWQAIGHGADAVLYWQWRSAPNGQEQYHGSMLGADGQPVPVYAEIQQLGADIEKVNAALAGNSEKAPGAPHLASEMPEGVTTTLHGTRTLPNAMAGSTPKSQVAILQSYDSHWAIDFQKHSNKFDYVTSVLDFYRAASPIAQSIDIISPEADLSSYPIVFAPALNVISDPLAKHLLDYVRQGGHLVLGPRSGMKTADDALQSTRQPGPLADALGATVAQYYALDAPVQVTPLPLAGAKRSLSIDKLVPVGKASIWAEDLHPTAPDVETVLTYGDGNGWLKSHPAAVQHRYGKGEMTYLGCDLDPKLMSAFIIQLLAEANIIPIQPALPEGVELMQRVTPTGTRIWIIENHTTKPQTLPTLPLGTAILGDSTIPLAPHQILIWSVK